MHVGYNKRQKQVQDHLVMILLLIVDILNNHETTYMHNNMSITTICEQQYVNNNI